jgi:tRNA(fMet)-specific endonuclease VapC
MVCVDTDFLVGLDRGNPKAFDKLKELEANGESISVTAITAAELYHGAYKAKDSERAIADVEDSLSRFSILSLDHKSAKTWGELTGKLKSNSIGDLDLFIASIALVNAQKLVTRNVKHFERVPDLKVESW